MSEIQTSYFLVTIFLIEVLLKHAEDKTYDVLHKIMYNLVTEVLSAVILWHRSQESAKVSNRNMTHKCKVFLSA